MQIIQSSFPSQELLCFCSIICFPWDNTQEKLGEIAWGFFHTPLQSTPQTSRISTRTWFCHYALLTKIPDTLSNLRLHCYRSRHGKNKKGNYTTGFCSSDNPSGFCAHALNNLSKLSAKPSRCMETSYPVWNILYHSL